MEDLVTTGLDDPRGIALDLSAGKMYWANRLAQKIQRANLDGSAVEDLIMTEFSPNGIAIDPQGGKVYWTFPGVHKIQRANLDGSNVEDVITGAPLPLLSIALDLIAGKIYWTLGDIVFGGEHAGMIQRANLDGSAVEDLVTTGPFTIPWGIALDVPAGKMYWTDDQVGGKIRRANLDGSAVEDLIIGVPAPRNIALDLSRDEIPAVSEWGLVGLALGLLTAARLVFRRRRVDKPLPHPGAPGRSGLRALGGLLGTLTWTSVASGFRMR
jgi:low density lipoprotein receptor-related protein 5/6